MGDSSYPKFNFTAKKLHKRLLQLGAKPIVPEPCLCDEQDRDGGSEAAYSRWSQEFFNASNASIFENSNQQEILKFKIIDEEDLVDDEERRGETTSCRRRRHVVGEVATEREPVEAELVRNARVTKSDHWQDVRLIELESRRPEDIDRIEYQAGDVCVLRPANTRSTCDKFLNIFEHLNLGISKTAIFIRNDLQQQQQPKIEFGD